jgi:hypothetical protein
MPTWPSGGSISEFGRDPFSEASPSPGLQQMADLAVQARVSMHGTTEFRGDLRECRTPGNLRPGDLPYDLGGHGHLVSTSRILRMQHHR